jgi:hypothetical protein
MPFDPVWSHHRTTGRTGRTRGALGADAASPIPAHVDHGFEALEVGLVAAADLRRRCFLDDQHGLRGALAERAEVVRVAQQERPELPSCPVDLVTVRELGSLVDRRLFELLELRHRDVLAVLVDIERRLSAHRLVRRRVDDPDRGHEVHDEADGRRMEDPSLETRRALLAPGAFQRSRRPP